MANFTPFSALSGGVLIGLAAFLLLAGIGRIAGVSGIVSGALAWPRGDLGWRLAFLGGLPAGAALFYWIFGGAPVGRTHFPVALLAVAGLLVGFGTTLGSGCTSGHGVCGIARFSTRSLVATLVFLTAGIVTAVVVRHVFGVTG
jgi:uncharacterized protein